MRINEWKQKYQTFGVFSIVLFGLMLTFGLGGAMGYALGYFMGACTMAGYLHLRVAKGENIEND